MEKIKGLQIEGVEFRLGVSLERYTTIRLQAKGSFAICQTELSLIKLIQKLNELEVDYHLVGWGANQVLKSNNNLLFIKLNFSFDETVFEKEKNNFVLPASTPLNRLSSIAQKYGFKGWEAFTGIPASLGGAICMNAGTALGEIGKLIKTVKILKKEGEIFYYKCNDTSFNYRSNNFLKRGDIILSAEVVHEGIDHEVKNKIKQYLDYRKETQPLTTKNCGSVFKNLPNFRAGEIIDGIGLKGFGLENIHVSFMHANFIENNGTGTSDEFVELIHELSEEIERISGLKFEFEVKVY